MEYTAINMSQDLPSYEKPQFVERDPLDHQWAPLHSVIANKMWNGIKKEIIYYITHQNNQESRTQRRIVQYVKKAQARVI